MAPHLEIVIIGDGFAAAVALVHLLRQGINPKLIAIIGERSLGKGNAYDCNTPSFRLNVREDLPIIFSEDPLHFARWAKERLNDPQAKREAGFFYRRSDFGKYTKELVSDQLQGRPLNQIKGFAKRIQKNGSTWNITLQSGEVVLAQNIILATGNASPIWPCPVNNKRQSKFQSHLIENPWTGGYLKDIHVNDSVMLLGGGLTALDAVSALVEQNHRGKVLVIAPRAIFPPSQASWSRQNEPNWPNPLTPSNLVRFMRNYLPDSPTDSSEWQCAWEELRPDINRIWQEFTDHQRRILMKRFGWLWNLYRFRASPQSIEAYQQLKQNQQIGFCCGRAQQIEVGEEGIKVDLGNGKRVTGQWLVNCTGVARDALLDQFISDDLALPDSLNKSIAVNHQFAVLQPTKEAYSNLWMIGPATMGSIGDVVAASAIAKQAEQLARKLRVKSFAKEIA